MGTGKGRGMEKPNFTQTPNVLIDELMRDMGEAELKVTLAIVRKTFGWHRERSYYEMSLSDLEAATGMSRPSVSKGIKAGIDRGTIKRHVDAEGIFYYGLVINDVDDEEEREPDLVRKKRPAASKESLPPPSKESLPEVVKNVYQAGKEFLPEPVKNLYQNTPTLNKEKESIKESSKEKESSSSARVEHQLTEMQDDDDDDSLQGVFAAWRDAMEPEPSNHRRKRLSDLAAQYGPEQVIRKILQCADAGGKTINYVITALENDAAGIEKPTRGPNTYAQLPPLDDGRKTGFGAYSTTLEMRS